MWGPYGTISAGGGHGREGRGRWAWDQTLDLGGPELSGLSGGPEDDVITSRIQTHNLGI